MGKYVLNLNIPYNAEFCPLDFIYMHEDGLEHYLQLPSMRIINPDNQEDKVPTEYCLNREEKKIVLGTAIVKKWYTDSCEVEITIELLVKPITKLFGSYCDQCFINQDGTREVIRYGRKFEYKKAGG